jgi:hypothetical protein
MKDALLSITKSLPNAAANNNTNGIDLGRAADVRDNLWRLGYLLVTVPALSDHTNTSVTNLLTLQDSADNSTFANTAPQIQVQVTGVASTGSVATMFKVPLPPGVRRYIRFNQSVPTNGGTGSNASVAYDLVV